LEERLAYLIESDYLLILSWITDLIHKEKVKRVRVFMSDVLKCYEDFCVWLTSVWYGSMQGIQDILLAGGSYITPVIKGLIDVTTGIFPGQSSNGKGKEVAKASKAKMSTNGPPEGEGLALTEML